MAHREHSTPPSERTRHRILTLLKEEGPSDSIAMAARLHLSAMAVRQHLYSLHDEGLVTYTSEPRRIGRPVKLWQLLPAADRFFPDMHPTLAIDLINATQQCFGEAGIQRLLNSRTSEQVSRLQETLPENSTLEDRLAALADEQTRGGFLAQVQVENEESYVLIERHCPVRAAAASCRQLCAAELLFFQNVLDGHARVERVEHILAGARCCVYRIFRPR